MERTCKLHFIVSWRDPTRLSARNPRCNTAAQCSATSSVLHPQIRRVQARVESATLDASHSESEECARQIRHPPPHSADPPSDMARARRRAVEQGAPNSAAASQRQREGYSVRTPRRARQRLPREARRRRPMHDATSRVRIPRRTLSTQASKDHQHAEHINNLTICSPTFFLLSFGELKKRLKARGKIKTVSTQ